MAERGGRQLDTGLQQEHILNPVGSFVTARLLGAKALLGRFSIATQSHHTAEREHTAAEKAMLPPAYTEEFMLWPQLVLESFVRGKRPTSATPVARRAALLSNQEIVSCTAAKKKKTRTGTPHHSSSPFPLRSRNPPPPTPPPPQDYPSIYPAKEGATSRSLAWANLPPPHPCPCSACPSSSSSSWPPPPPPRPAAPPMGR